MRNKELQIVTFDNPYPPDYGGVIDVYYKIKALSELGVKIYLHIFFDVRDDISSLKPLCERVFLYKRNKSFVKHFSLLPYCVNTRLSKELFKNLNEIQAPIFFESLRATGVLKRHEFNQKILIRCHNIEHDYSWGLSKSENNWPNKVMFFIEGQKLKYYESILNKANALFTLSYYDQAYYNKHYKNKAIYLPIFQKNNKVLSKNGYGEYALYHGDLRIADNVKSAFFIIDVFKNLEYKLKITSSIENKKLLSEIGKYDNITFEYILSEEHLESLIENAHINVLYSFQRSGTKLKVFNALYKGRFCILNKNMVDDPDILKVCEIAENTNQYADKVQQLFKTSFSFDQERYDALKKYDATHNAKKILDLDCKI